MISCVSLSLLFLLAANFLGLPTDAEEGTCAAKRNHYVEDAHVRFGLLVSLRSKPLEDSSQDCRISHEGLEHYLTVEWLVDRINHANNGMGYIPGVKIGFEGLDDCGMPIYATRNSLLFTHDYLPYAPNGCSSSAGNNTAILIGMVAASNSPMVQSVATNLKDFPMPIITSMATVPELSDKAKYPNVLRTVPCDVKQMTLIVDILENLLWTYVAVAYQMNSYGTSAVKVLQEKAKERNICIHKTIPIPGEDLSDQFQKIIESAKYGSVAVVVIADSTPTEQLLYALWSRPSTRNKDFHFIMTDSVNTNVEVFKTSDQRRGALALSTGSIYLLKDLKDDLNLKFSQHVQGANTERHNLIQEYINAYPTSKSKAFIPDSMSAFIPSTINCVFTLVEALKSLHQKHCGNQDQLCEAMKTKLNTNEFLDTVFNVNVTYKDMDATVVPASFLNNNVSFKFDDGGNIYPLTGLADYTVSFYDPRTLEYKQVGSYANGKMDLNDLYMKNQLQLGALTSICAGRCDKCLTKSVKPLAFLEGDVYILGIFSIHKADLSDPFKCGTLRRISNDVIVAEGFLFAVKELRTKTGINFGAIGFDDCYSPLHITSLLTHYFSDTMYVNSEHFSHHIPIEKVAGVIGCLSSGCTLTTASFFMPLNKPVVSYASSSPDLDDRIDYPYFLRTPPSDKFQATVMVNIIKQMGWEYVGLLYVKNNYGAKGMRAFRNIADKNGSGICVAKEIGINEKQDENDGNNLYKALLSLNSQNVKVVVFFGIDNRIGNFLAHLEQYDDSRKYIFLGSEDWGTNKNILVEREKSARGSITLKLQKIGLESEASFHQHLIGRKPVTEDSNIWFREYWQNLFDCSFPGGFNNVFQNECHSTNRLSDNQVDDLIQDQRLRHIINAVFAMGHGFHDIKKSCQGRFPCPSYDGYPEKVVAIIQNQTRTVTGKGNVPVFDKNGNGAIGFEVYNIQQMDNQYVYVQVGDFTAESSRLAIDEMKFYDKNGKLVQSKIGQCVEKRCDACSHMRTMVPVTSEARSKEPSDYQDSDILIVSLVVVLGLAILVAIAVVVICFSKKCKVIEKKLFMKEEQIYAEPGQEVYPGAYNAPGRNLVFSDPNISPYQGSNYLDVGNGSSSPSGINNMAYMMDSDHVDSVSQVMAVRKPQSDGNNYNRPNSDTDPQRGFHISNHPLPHIAAGHSLPVTAIEGQNFRPSDNDPNFRSPQTSMSPPLHHPRGPLSEMGNLTQDPQSFSPNQAAMMYPSMSIPEGSSIGAGVIMSVPYSSSHGSTDSQEMIMYYMRDQSGKLTALVPSHGSQAVPPQTQQLQYTATQPVHQTSAMVHIPPSASVLDDHRPYNNALIQQKILQGDHNHMGPQSPVESAPVPAMVLNTVPEHSIDALAVSARRNQGENMEMRDISVNKHQTQPHSPPQGHAPQVQRVAETHLNNESPMHYASPSHTHPMAHDPNSSNNSSNGSHIVHQNPNEALPYEDKIPADTGLSSPGQVSPAPTHSKGKYAPSPPYAPIMEGAIAKPHVLDPPQSMPDVITNQANQQPPPQANPTYMPNEAEFESVDLNSLPQNQGKDNFAEKILQARKEKNHLDILSGKACISNI